MKVTTLFKTMALLAIIILNSNSLFAQLEKTVTITEAGTLADYFTGSETEITTNLTVTGNIDARDFIFIKDSLPALLVLDISATDIVAYSGTEGTYFGKEITYNANTIPNSAFYNETQLEQIICPESLTKVGAHAFRKTQLDELTIPPKVDSIFEYAFEGATINKLVLPESLTYIQNATFSAFYAEHIYLQNPKPVYYGDLLSPDSFKLRSSHLIVPKGSLTLYKNAKFWKDFTFKYEYEPLIIDPQNISLGYESGTSRIYIIADSAWHANTTSSWIEFTSTTEYYVDFSYQNNTEFTSRKDTIVISTSDGYSKSIQVTQLEACKPKVVYGLSDTIFISGEKDTTIQLQTTADCNWGSQLVNDLYYSSYGGNVIHYEQYPEGDSVIEFTITANNLNVNQIYELKALSDCSCDYESPDASLIIKQSAIITDSLIVLDTLITLPPYESSYYGTTVSSYYEFTAESNNDWLSVNLIQLGDKTYFVGLNCEANEYPITRKAAINIIIDSKIVKKIQVTQEASTPSVENASVTFKDSIIIYEDRLSYDFRDYIDFTTNSNKTLNAISDANWFSYSLNGFDYSYTLTLIPKANLDTVPREAIVYFTAIGDTIGQLKIKQEKGQCYLCPPKEIVLDESFSNLSGNNPFVEGEYYSYTSFAPGVMGYSVSSSDWINTQMLSHGMFLDIYAEANLNNYTRTGYVNLNSVYGTEQIKIIQPAFHHLPDTSLFFSGNDSNLFTYDLSSYPKELTYEKTDDWINADIAEHEGIFQLQVSVEKNSIIEERIGFLYVKHKDTIATIKVTQAKAELELLLSTSDITLNSMTDTSGFVIINSNTQWTAKSDQEWLRVEIKNDTVILTATQNMAIQNKTATVIISAEGVGDQAIAVTQVAAEPFIIIGKDSVKLSASESQFKIMVNSNTQWTAKSDQEWLTVEIKNDTVILTATQNMAIQSKTATVIISAEGVGGQAIAVTQVAAEPFIITGKDSVKLSASESQFKIMVNSNTQWTAKSDQEWLTVEIVNDSVTLITSENNTTEIRSAKVTISADGTDANVISITQAPTTLTALEDIDAIIVSPNPAKEYFKINIPDKAFIQLMNTAGRTVYEKNIKGGELIPTKNIPAGAYILRIKQNNSIETVTLIVK